MSKKKKNTKKRIRDPRSPQLFSNEELGLPPEEMEYRGTKIVVNKHGERVRVAVITSTKEQYVQQANDVWHGCYDYTDSVYEDKLKPIVIYCPKHELHFTVAMAQNHIMKHNATGCPVCAAEKRHSREYGPDWRDYLKLSPNSNRVGAIRPEYIPKTEEQSERERIEQENRKREKEERRLQREREQQELMTKYGAKSMPEARFIEKVQQQYGYDTALVDYQGQDTDVTLFCPIHGMFEITPRILFNGVKGSAPHGCWLCAELEDPHTKYRLTAREFYRRTDARYGKKIIFERKRKIKPTTNITGTCYRHGAITHNAAWWLSGKGCEYCTGQKVYYPLWKEYARQVHGDKYEYVGEAPAMATDLIHYICKEHGLIEQRFDIHVSQGCGCPKCANYPNKKSPEQRCQEWIEKSDEKFRGEFDYSETHADYMNNDSKVWLTHKPCGTRFQITPDTHLRGVNGGCPVCNVIFLESRGERTIRLWLEDHHIDHGLQHKLPNEDPTLPLQYLKTDFWIDDFDGQPLVIEYNGELHYEDIGHFYRDRVRNFEVQQHRDRYLRLYCHDQGYRLLEIPYWEFDHIDSILTNVLLNHEPIPTFEHPTTTDTQQAPTEA